MREDCETGEEFRSTNIMDDAYTESNRFTPQQAARIRELFDRCKEQDAQIEKLQSDLDQALQQQSSYKSRVEEELEAYRRAERTERLARERAERMYQQANGVLADATVKVDDAATQIGALSDRVISQLTELQNAVSGSKQALQDASSVLSTLRPNR